MNDTDKRDLAEGNDTVKDGSPEDDNDRPKEAPWAEQYRKDLKELQKINPKIDFIGGDGSPRSDRDLRK